MGEHAQYAGSTVKIGTCENMYYLRADQRHLIGGYDFGAEVLDAIRFRFPFPDEDDQEPGTFGVDYDRGVRIPGWSLPGELSGDEHGKIQLTSPVGYVLSIPCPEGRRLEGDDMSTVIGMSRETAESAASALSAFHSSNTDALAAELRRHAGDAIRVGRNGFNGGPVVRQQAFRGGVLVTLVSCGACGALHRLDTLEDAEPVIEAFMSEAAREEYRRLPDGTMGFGPAHEKTGRAFLREMAARIMAGYFVRPDSKPELRPLLADVLELERLGLVSFRDEDEEVGADAV